MYQVGQRIRPKGPQGAQRCGKGAEEQHRAAQSAQHRKAPQLSGTPAQSKQKAGGAHRQTVADVQQSGEPGKTETKGT